MKSSGFVNNARFAKRGVIPSDKRWIKLFQARNQGLATGQSPPDIFKNMSGCYVQQQSTITTIFPLPENISWLRP